MRADRGRACGIVSILTALLVAPIGCASRHYGTEQRVNVRSEPPGATVYVGDRYAGVTPVEVTLAGGPLATELRLRKEGYVPVDVPVPRTASKWLWGNLGVAMYVPIASSYADGLTGADHAANFGLTLAVAVGVDLLTGAGLRAPATVRPTLRRRPVRRGPAPEGIVLPDPRPGTNFEDAVPSRFRHAGER